MVFLVYQNIVNCFFTFLNSDALYLILILIDPLIFIFILFWRNILILFFFYLLFLDHFRNQVMLVVNQQIPTYF